MRQFFVKDRIDQVLLPVLASICLGLFGPICLALPFSSVPFTTQSFMLLFFSLLLGPQKALFMGALFLLEGMLGCPFFSYGRFGIPMLIGPTGGYLLGYVLGGYVASFAYEWMQQKYRANFTIAFVCFCIGFFVISVCGFFHLSLWIGKKQAFLQGVLPFLGADCIKACIGATMLVRFRKIGL